MKTRASRIVAAVAGAALCLLSRDARACSTFVIHDGPELLYGRNFDFFMDGGYVLTNRRGVAKTALVDPPQAPVRWISRYGSVTFNQAGQEFPYGGMNEAGLVVENMWLQAARYPAADERPAIAELQWIQDQLDTAATVAEVLASDGRIRIDAAGKPIHFLVADASGAAATVEFIAGRAVVHSGPDLPVPALTNDTYDDSLAYLRLHAGFGGGTPIAATRGSLDRFATVAAMLGERRGLRGEAAVGRAFEILDAVAHGARTVWSAVYDVAGRRVFFKSVGNTSVRSLRMSDLRFDCAGPSWGLPVDGPGRGDVGRTAAVYTPEINGALVRSTFARYRDQHFADVPAADQDLLARYPSTLVCQPAPAR